MLSRYHLLAPLGAGGMGTVYRAYDRLARTYVALKRVSTQPVAREATASSNPLDVRLALAREFQALAALHHPHIIAVRDYGFDHDHQPYFTMELIPDAVTLLDAGQGQPLTAQVALIVQLLYALDYLHQRGIIHRDLKPGNILVTRGQVKVLDFGLAALSGQTGQFGTLAYMAPEALRGEELGAAADLYTVGVMAYELFTGRHPFRDAPIGMIEAALGASPDWVRVPEPLRAPLASLLAKTPSARVDSARAVIASLSVALSQTFPAENESIRESFLQTAPLAGRDAELAQLTTALDATLSGQGSGWLIGGESGVGKSRLLDELRTRALVQGAMVLPGQAISEGGGPLHVWRNVARWLALLADPDDFQAGVLAPLVPDIAELIERPIAAAPPLPPDAAQTRLFAVFTDLVGRALAAHPLVILLSDLHWADDNSLQLLDWLARLLPTAPLLILADYRNDEAASLLERFPAFTPLSLNRLTASGIAALSTSILGSAGTNPAIVNFLQRESEGNTFFIVEVVRALAEEAGQLDRIAYMTLPPSVFGGGIRRVVERRLRRVSAEDRAALQVAALAGRQLDLALLAEMGINAVDQWLTRCAASAILERQGGLWHFQHDKLREGLLLEIDVSQRRAIHHRLALAIEQVYAADLSAHYPELAHHFSEANVPERETHYAQRAGEQAAGQYANAAALTYLTRALTLTPATDRARRYTLIQHREAIYDLQGNRADQHADLQTLTALAEQLGDPARRAEALTRQANSAEVTSDYARAVYLAQAAIRLAHDTQLIEIEARARVLAARALWEQNDYPAARAELEPALALAHAAHLRALEAETLRNLGVLADYLNERDTARGYHTRALEIFQALGDKRGEARVNNNLAVNTWHSEHYGAAQIFAARGWQLARAIGDRRLERVFTGNLGLYAMATGDYATAQGYLQTTLEICRAIGEREGEGWALGNIAEISYQLGLHSAAIAYARQAIEIIRAVGARNFLAYCLETLGFALADLRQFAEAEAAFTEALELNLAIAPTLPPLIAQAGLAHVALRRGDYALAVRHVEDLLPYLTNEVLRHIEMSARPEWVAYTVLRASGDDRAPAVLAAAHARLLARAAYLTDSELRRKFFENIPEHCALLAAVSENSL